jgi:hypothetical protein
LGRGLSKGSEEGEEKEEQGFICYQNEGSKMDAAATQPTGASLAAANALNSGCLSYGNAGHNFFRVVRVAI